MKKGDCFSFYLFRTQYEYPNILIDQPDTTYAFTFSSGYSNALLASLVTSNVIKFHVKSD